MKTKLQSSLKGFASSVRFYGVGIYRKFSEDDIILYGSAIAFNIILCIIPLLLLLTAIVGSFLSSSQQAFQHINDLLDAAFPDQPYANKIKLSIQSIVYDIVVHRKSFGWVSILTLVWTTTFLFNAARDVLNRVFGISRTKLFFNRIMENVISVVSVVLLFLVANASFLLSSIFEGFVEGIPEIRDLVPIRLIHSFPFLVTMVLAMLMFFIIYHFIPDRRIPSKSALVATCTTAILWILSGKAFQIYLVKFATFRQLYGAYAFMLVFLLWIEYSSIIFIIGAMVGQLHRERHHPETLAKKL